MKSGFISFLIPRSPDPQLRWGKKLGVIERGYIKASERVLLH